MRSLQKETISLISQIYDVYVTGGCLHIVLDDGNVDSTSIRWCLCNTIPQEKDPEKQELFVKCACNLLEIGGERKRRACIHKAFMQMAGIRGGTAKQKWARLKSFSGGFFASIQKRI